MIKMKEILVPWYLIFAESFCPIRSSLSKLSRVTQPKSSFINNLCTEKNETKYIVKFILNESLSKLLKLF